MTAKTKTPARDYEAEIFDYLVEHGPQTEQEMILGAGFSKEILLAHGPAAADRYNQATRLAYAA